MKNETKALMYQETIKRYKKALNAGCYFECILIDYSLLEDRLTDFFVKIDFANKNNGTTKFQKFRRMDLLSIGIPDNICNFSKLSNKIEMVKSIVEFTKGPADPDSIYLKALKNVLNKNNIECVFSNQFFDELDNWRKERNSIIHNLLNANDIIFDSLKDLAESGFRLFRLIDAFVNKIKGKVKKEIIKLKKTEQS